MTRAFDRYLSKQLNGQNHEPAVNPNKDQPLAEKSIFLPRSKDDMFVPHPYELDLDEFKTF